MSTNWTRPRTQNHASHMTKNSIHSHAPFGRFGNPQHVHPLGRVIFMVPNLIAPKRSQETREGTLSCSEWENRLADSAHIGNKHGHNMGVSLLVHRRECGNEPRDSPKENHRLDGILGAIPILIPCPSRQQVLQSKGPLEPSTVVHKVGTFACQMNVQETRTLSCSKQHARDALF